MPAILSTKSAIIKYRKWEEWQRLQGFGDGRRRCGTACAGRSPSSCPRVHSLRYGLETYYYNDMANNLRTGHMDVTFQPTFYASPYRDTRQPNGQGVATGPARNVHNILGAEWQSKLRLEALEDPEPPRKRPRALMSVSSSLEFVAQGPAQVSEMPLVRPAVTWAEPVEWPALTPLPAGLTEDIGTFETYEPKPFAAPKPGLKSKRSSGRGRGVMGAVLAADGSVTH